MPIQEQIKDQLHKLLPSLKEKYSIEKLGLFGSVTRDDFTPDSDVDIFVSFTKPIGFEFFDLEAELSQALGRKVDLVSEKAIKPHYLPYISRSLIYV
jgi:predicted nucleotidyltransferase